MKYQRRSKKSDEEENTDVWLLTYSDLVTQILCFFILLMSFSVIGSMKFREAAISLNEALSGTGVLPNWDSPIGDLPRSINEAEGKTLKLKEELDKKIKENKMTEHVETVIRKSGLAIILKQRESSIFFDTADAQIKKEAYPILNMIGQVIKGLPNNIRIEGHTDIRPISTPQFPSNWELSTMRATNVLRYLLSTTGIGPDRLSAAGYGPHRPIAHNDTEDGMSKNRRVEIIILRTGDNPDMEEVEPIPDNSPELTN